MFELDQHRQAVRFRRVLSVEPRLDGSEWRKAVKAAGHSINFVYIFRLYIKENIN